MAYDFLGLTNDVNRRLNEVELTSSNFSSSTGAYGVGKVKVHYYGNDKIWGQESDPEIVTGGLQALSGMGGLLVRFQGASITDGDTWEIEVNSATRQITNAQSNAIDLTRRGYTY